jgi:hypothetical protein
MPDQGHRARATGRRRYYAIAYDVAELRTFHCDRACKITLSWLDSILHLYKNEADRINLRQRVAEVRCNIRDTYLLALTGDVSYSVIIRRSLLTSHHLSMILVRPGSIHHSTQFR